MTMLARETETRELTLADYEARIHLYKEQIGTGYIGIGRTLLEAKEAKVVPHGQWEQWMTETTGLTARQAQRCMEAAREIKNGSAMARLEMSKALMLLGSGLDEEAREEIAEKAAEGRATVNQLREEIKQTKLKLLHETGATAEIREKLKNAEDEKQSLADQLRDVQSAYEKRIGDAETAAYQRGARETEKSARERVQKEYEKKIKDEKDAAYKYGMEVGGNGANFQIGSLKAEKANLEKKITGLENEINKSRQYAEELRKELDEKQQAAPANHDEEREMLLEAAAEAEQRAANAEAELEALKAGGGAAESVSMVLIRAWGSFLRECGEMPYNPEAMAGRKDAILDTLDEISDWHDRMVYALRGVFDGEGAVE